MTPRHFIAHAEGTFTCQDCAPADTAWGDSDVEVWEERSHGWTGPIVCACCKLSIPVYVDDES